MVIPKPIHEPNHDDYLQDLVEVLDLPIALLADQAMRAGWGWQQVFTAIVKVARTQAAAYEADPDRAED